MDFQTVLAIIFVIFLTFFLIKKRKEVDLQKLIFPLLYFVLYRTKLGLKSMEKIAKKLPRLVKYGAYVGIVLGFIGMILISYSLVINIYKILTVPTAISAVVPVLPFKIKGGLYVPFLYWIISIFVIAVVHEFSHGIVARRYNIRLKSSGFAFLGIVLPIIPAAFVEPDEKEMAKKPKKEQLSVFAAGPFSNIILGIICLLIVLIALNPVGNAILDYRGVEITDYTKMEGKTFPAEEIELKGEVITKIDNASILTIDNFTKYMETKKPGDNITILTENNTYNVALSEHPQNNSMPYLGVYVRQKSEIKEEVIASYGKYLPNFLLWIIGLFFWLYLLNVGIGLFNLAPLGPVDGGRMLHTGLLHFFKEKAATKYWKAISWLFLALILANLIFAFVK